MTTEQFEELKAIQDAYLEMVHKRQEEVETLEEMDLSFIKGAKPRGSVEDQKKARAEMIAKRDAEKPKTSTKSDVKVDTSRGYGKGRYMGDSVEETEQVLESERSKKFKEIGASLDRMMAKAAANTELQKLKKQNKEHKKLPEEVESEDEIQDVEEAFIPDSRSKPIGDSDKNKLSAIADLIKKERAKKSLAAKMQQEEVEELEEADTYGWRTTKTPEGHKWNVHSFTYGQGEKVLHSGIEDTRAKAVARAKKHVMPYRRGVKEEVELDEARAKKEPMQVYHPTYSSAVQHARANAEKQGYTVSDDDWFHHVNSGPGKPSGGKTTRHVIPLHKDGKPTKKALAIQVHDRQTDKNSYELNSYIN
jgi:hypothetical protein